jgi:hypothetical protein
MGTVPQDIFGCVLCAITQFLKVLCALCLMGPKGNIVQETVCASEVAKYLPSIITFKFL